MKVIEKAMVQRKVGGVTRYDATHLRAEVELSDTLRVGDCIHIKGRRSDWWQSVTSMRLGEERIAKARAGQTIWLDVIKRAYNGDEVFILLTADFTPLPGPEPGPGPSPPRWPPADPIPELPPGKLPPADDPNNDENDEPPDLPDPNDFEIDSEEKEKEGGEGG
jgi:hypothetical protein